jgi:hypothetical protein
MRALLLDRAGASRAAEPAERIFGLLELPELVLPAR